jgi:hypothetical protein
MLQRAKIKLFGGNTDAFLGQENADAPRIWSATAIVKLHRHPSFIERSDLSAAHFGSPEGVGNRGRPLIRGRARHGLRNYQSPRLRANVEQSGGDCVPPCWLYLAS